jgi:hypothetical protein
MLFSVVAFSGYACLNTKGREKSINFTSVIRRAFSRYSVTTVAASRSVCKVAGSMQRYHGSGQRLFPVMISFGKPTALNSPLCSHQFARIISARALTISKLASCRRNSWDTEKKLFAVNFHTDFVHTLEKVAQCMPSVIDHQCLQSMERTATIFIAMATVLWLRRFAVRSFFIFNVKFSRQKKRHQHNGKGKELRKHMENDVFTV